MKTTRRESTPDPQLLDAAREARERAIAPYSNYKVGAALRTASGAIVTGCNIENASFGLTMCAERVALLKALSEGERAFTAVAVVTAGKKPGSPCGPCRQLLWEFCGDITVTLATIDGDSQTFHMRDLLPEPFDGKMLEE